MRLQEWIESTGINDKIYDLVEKSYRRGYNDGLAGRNRIFQDPEMDRVATDLIDRVLGGVDDG